MYKRRLKSVIWIDPQTGNREEHILDNRGLPQEGIKRSKKKNVKIRKPLTNFPIGFEPMTKHINLIPISQINQSQYQIKKQGKPIQMDYPYQPEPPSPVDCSQFLSKVPPKHPTSPPQHSLFQDETEAPVLNLASFIDDIDFLDYSCQSSMDISMFSWDEGYSDTLEVTSLHGY